MRQNSSVSETTILKYDFDRHELLPFVPRSVHTFLDIGCGSGAFGRLLRMQRPDIELWAIEPDPSSARAAEAGFDRVVQGTFPNPQIPNGKFDAVLCADVLEHMSEPESTLLACKEAMTPGSTLIASIPNVRNWRSVLWPLLFHGTWIYTERGILDRTHLRFFTRQTMHTLFTDNGWSVVSVTGINMGRRERLLSLLSCRLFDEFLFPQYVVVARPDL
jgi:2-polyprenyl-3-methyl-5-hydroxy-6-metoxy-1,4-benzoquinol methylase